MSAWFYQAVEISTQLIIPYNNNFPDKFPYSPFFLPLSSPKRIYQHKTPWTITFTVSFRLFFVQIYQSLLKQGERGGRSYRRPPVSISGNTKPIPGCLCAAYQPRLVEFLSLSLSLSLSLFVRLSLYLSSFSRGSRLQRAVQSGRGISHCSISKRTCVHTACRLIIPVNEGPRFAARRIDRSIDRFALCRAPQTARGSTIRRALIKRSTEDAPAIRWSR